jgi:choline dehydrogenase-like flavoprotein
LLIDLQQSHFPSHLRPDVLIIGAGAVGLATAASLVRRGAEVAVLEAGSTSLEKRSQQFFEAATWRGYPLEGLHAGRLRVLGGTTNAWPGQLVPFDPVVFEHRPWVSDEAWPIDRETLEPYYRKAFEILGLAQNKSDEEVWRALRVPMPDLGDDLDVFLTRWTPEPRFALLFQNEILHHPKLHVLVNAPVTGLSLAADGNTVQKVVVRRGDGATFGMSARHIILANGTIEIARLLSLDLAEGAKAPWARNPWLGQGFVDHVDAYAGAVIPIDKARFHRMFDNILLHGLKYSPRVKLAGTAQRKRRLLGIAAGFLFNSQYKEDLDRLKILMKTLLRGKVDSSLLEIPARTVPVARIALPMAARYLRHRRAYNPADQGIQLRLSCEQVPLQESRLQLRPDRDALGMPMVNVEWMIDGIELETMAQFCDMLVERFRREQLARIELNPMLSARDPAFLSQIDDGNHQMGMARMSSTEKNGVVDADLRVFGSRNLYVAGAATFPTTGFENPTFTAITLGLRLADHLLTGTQQATVASYALAGGAR